MKRSTLFMALSFAAIAGYQRIILCGVDLNNPHYFYRHPDYQHLPQLPEIPDTGSALGQLYAKQGVQTQREPDPKIHNTMDPALNPLPMSEIIWALNEEVLQPLGINLYVALDSSALHPRIPAYYS